MKGSITKLQEVLTSTRLILITVVIVFFVLVNFSSALPAGTVDSLHRFFTLGLSIIVAALPFLLLGVVLSALVSVFIDEQVLLKYLPRNRWLSHILISLLGMLLPVCECGNIPLARRLMLKGFSASQALTFLLAAPIINVVTIWSTWEAFRGDPIVLIARIAGAFIIANFIGILFSYHPNQSELLSQGFQAMFRSRHTPSLPKYKLFLNTVQQEFWLVFRMLVLGAAIAAAIRVFVPDQVIVGLANNPITSILVMMLLGLVISICSSVDAFFALSLASIFNLGAITSFLVFGPMIDLKILSMLKASFSGKTLAMLTMLVALMAFITGLIVNIGI